MIKVLAFMSVIFFVSSLHAGPCNNGRSSIRDPKTGSQYGPLPTKIHCIAFKKHCDTYYGRDRAYYKPKNCEGRIGIPEKKAFERGLRNPAIGGCWRGYKKAVMMGGDTGIDKHTMINLCNEQGFSFTRLTKF